MPTSLRPRLLVFCTLSCSAANAPPQREPCLQPPVGPPDGSGYYVAQGFGPNHHLGEDWNGVGGGNTDLGDPVSSIAAGVVTEARDAGRGWGNVVRVTHRLSTASGPLNFESVYAHLDTMAVTPGQAVARGGAIGTIGDAHGAYVAHLHLELRTVIGMPLGPGYSENTHGYADPRQWIEDYKMICLESKVSTHEPGSIER